MPQVKFEPTIPVFEQAKTVHALDRAASVLGMIFIIFGLNSITYPCLGSNPAAF
jgi:hypothetical protein